MGTTTYGQAPVQIGKSFDWDFGYQDRPNSDDFNRRWADIDRRITQTEGFMPSWEAVVSGITDDSVSRIDNVITPIAQRLEKIASLGFLIAYSTESHTLHEGDVVVFQLTPGDQTDLFTPSPFLVLERLATPDDYAVAQLVSFDNVSGKLTISILTVGGNPGPHNDWSVSVSPGVSVAIRNMLAQVLAGQQDVDSVLSQVTQLAAAAASSSTGAATAAGNASGLAGQALTSAQKAAASAAAAASSAQSVSAQNIVKADGSTPFTGVQTGVAPVSGANDSSLVTSSWVRAAIAALVAQAPAALDTLKELADAIGDDANFAATMTTALGNRVRVDANQAFTAAQKSQAIANIGAQAALGFTPVQQGTGPGQANNVVKIGYDGAGVRLAIDATDFGHIWADAFGYATFGASGYVRLPNGLIIQWGTATPSAGNWTWSYPTAFPNALLSLQGLSPTPNTTTQAIVNTLTVSNSQATGRSSGFTSSGTTYSNINQPIYFLAIGY